MESIYVYDDSSGGIYTSPKAHSDHRMFYIVYSEKDVKASYEEGYSLNDYEEPRNEFIVEGQIVMRNRQSIPVRKGSRDRKVRVYLSDCIQLWFGTGVGRDNIDDFKRYLREGLKPPYYFEDQDTIKVFYGDKGARFFHVIDEVVYNVNQSELSRYNQRFKKSGEFAPNEWAKKNPM